jgi:hypothetical protein
MHARSITVLALAALIISTLLVGITSAAPAKEPALPPNSPAQPIKPDLDPQHGRVPQKESALRGAVSASGVSYRQVTLYPGWTTVSCTDSSISPYSWVYASVTEVASDGSGPFLGAAHFIVGNVVPRSGYVLVSVHSDWDSSLTAWVNCYKVDL